MKRKKEKSIALELIDDLLNDDEQESETQELASQNKREEPGEPGSGNTRELLKTEVVSPSASVRSDDDTKQTSGDEASKTIGRTTITPADDKTVPLSQNQSGEDESSKQPFTQSQTQTPHPAFEKVQVRTGAGQIGGGRFHGVEASLAQSENLRIAQKKILEFEKEIDQLREENEELSAAGETLRKRSDELLAQVSEYRDQYDHEKEAFKEEKQILLQSIDGRDKKISELELKIEELETRLTSNIQKIRVRERELENRLELVKMENAALVRNKDEIILDLKRQIDKFGYELDNYRHKGQELNKKLDDKQDVLKRTVKALRIALSMLEGSDRSSSDSGGKKAS